MGDYEALASVGVESTLEYHSVIIGSLTDGREPVTGHWQSGSLTGAVASQKVTEAFKGYLSTVGNRASSAKAKGSLTARPTRRAESKDGLSDPAVERGIAVAQRIKVTLGITG